MESKDKDNGIAKIFCGDFNTEPESESLSILHENTEKSLKCAFEGTPFSTFKTRETTVIRKIDYMKGLFVFFLFFFLIKCVSYRFYIYFIHQRNCR